MTTPATSRTWSLGARGGIFIAAGGVLLLLDLLGASLYVDDTYSFPFWGTIARVLAALALFIGFCLVAIDQRPGSLGAVPAARGGLIVFGAGSAASMLLTALTADALSVRAVGVLLIQLATVAGLVIAAVSARRASSGGHRGRALLAALAVEQALWTVLSLIPTGGTLGIASALYVLFPLLLIVFAAVLITEGRPARAVGDGSAAAAGEASRADRVR